MENEAAADEKTITLGGKPYRIPVLALRQNRRVHAARLVNSASSDESFSVLKMDDAAIDDMTLAVRVALPRAYPDMTDDQFEELPMGMADLVAALPVIIDQAGLFVVQGA